MRYILIFTLILVNSQEVTYQIEAANYPDGLDVDQWFIIGNVNGQKSTICNGVDVYGGYGAFTYDTIIQKAFFDLQPHFQIKVEINLLLFGLTLGELKIENDNNEIFIVSPASPLTRSCSENSIEYQLQVLDFEFPHQRRNYIFKMFQAYFDNIDATWGFDSFKISIYKCPFGCLQCLGYDDLNCGFWSKLQFSFIQCQLEDTDIQQWGGGSEYNVDEFGSCQGINSISLENSFLLPPSDDILIRFLINKNTDLTIWINENRIDIQQQGVIDISLQKQFGPTLNIKIRDLNNQLDWMIRDLEIYFKIRSNYIENEIIIPQIILECVQFIDQFCLDCQEGWELDILQNICVTQCGDNMISGFEECEDGNQIQYDGCYMCKIQCIQFCQICIHGICMLCLNGYSFNNNQECSLNCEDKIIIPYYNEECSDENFLQFHGCFQCLKYEECIYGCLKCDHQICYLCQPDFLLIQGRCLSNCGRNDEILYEDCEDFNKENNIELLCPLYCIECNFQQCLICDEQYELLEDGSCKLSIDDELDNIYQLIQKDDIICRKIPFECNYQKSPQVNLSYINITLNKQYVYLEFTEQVKSESQKLLSQTLIIEIFNISNKIYNYDLIIIQDSDEYFTNVQLIIEIEIFQLLETKPILFLNLNQCLVNSFGQSVIQDQAILTLELPQYLDENEKQISNRLKIITMSTIYGFFGVYGISVLFCNFQYFLVILNMIYYLSILRYINLKFPQNLDIYFQAYDVLTIEPLLSLLSIDLIYDVIFTNIYKESSGKFKYYGQNADLISNIYCQILQCLIFLLFGLIAGKIKILVYNYIFCQRYFLFLDKVVLFIKSTYVLKCNQLFYYGIKSFILEIQELITFKGIKQLLFFNGWDLILKVLLYLNSIQLSNSRDIIQLIIAIIIFTSYLFIVLYSIWKEVHFCITHKLIQDKNRFQILYLFKQTFQLYLLIFLDCSEVIQLGFFFLTSLLNLKLIFTYRHIFVNSLFLINTIVESSVLLFTLTSFIYIQDFEDYISVSYKIKCGWFHITILSLGLFSEIFMICKDIFKSIINNCRKQQEVKINNKPIVV